MSGDFAVREDAIQLRLREPEGNHSLWRRVAVARAGPPAEVADLLTRLTALPGHEFWPDDITLLDSGRFDSGRLLESAQVTDSYPLALAAAHGGRLATFDRSLVTDGVANGARSLSLIS